jgi:hypothetical protein
MIDTGYRKWKCSKGHEWSNRDAWFLMPVSLQFGIKSTPSYCPFCLQEKIEELLKDVPVAEEEKSG